MEHEKKNDWTLTDIFGESGTWKKMYDYDVEHYGVEVAAYTKGLLDGREQAEREQSDETKMYHLAMASAAIATKEQLRRAPRVGTLFNALLFHQYVMAEKPWVADAYKNLMSALRSDNEY